MAEQPAMDSATDNSVEQKPVEQKIYKSEHDAVDDMKTLLGLQEKSSEPEATRTHEVESEVSNPEESDSTKNNEDLGEDAELINLLDEEEPNESNEELIDLDGEKLTLEEIKKERLRQKDYTQKTQKLAEERKEIDSLKASLSKEYDVAKQQRDYYQQQLQVLTKTLFFGSQVWAINLAGNHLGDMADLVGIRSALQCQKKHWAYPLIFMVEAET